MAASPATTKARPFGCAPNSPLASRRAGKATRLSADGNQQQTYPRPRSPGREMEASPGGQKGRGHSSRGASLKEIAYAHWSAVECYFSPDCRPCIRRPPQEDLYRKWIRRWQIDSCPPWVPSVVGGAESAESKAQEHPAGGGYAHHLGQQITALATSTLPRLLTNYSTARNKEGASLDRASRTCDLTGAPERLQQAEHRPSRAITRGASIPHPGASPFH
ncbi:hypothetical protein MAPG_11332 [Magnaporthiopsis poae ATCC 64411]|uniref:Uncharacterized protein n=1 Tax=Magnaporthiopsis poae (strain ATCC 64411 / 73-15) TaxID=644358 RepID=A0A0C4EEZ9_MAGP6|nr:hypothetical protein MAPG_11332 [Magnaporthiopsis poae ATCC 64411]